jgi:hypothetical protein
MMSVLMRTHSAGLAVLEWLKGKGLLAVSARANRGQLEDHDNGLEAVDVDVFFVGRG